MPLENTIDAMWSLAGDLVKSNGGIITTKGYPFLATRQIIRNRILATRDSWYLDPQISAQLDVVIGETNNEETGKRIETQITSALTHDSFCTVSDISVKAVPISFTAIAVRIKVVVKKDNTVYSIYESLIARPKTLGGVSVIPNNDR